LYPDASIAFKLPDARPLSWVVRLGASDLVQQANQFLADAQGSGEVARIAQQSSTESGELGSPDGGRVGTDMPERLPERREMFEEAAAVTGIDWRLLAAVGYQESRWQMQASSGDG